MSEIFTYLVLGYNHITDLAGYDHILFVVALCAIYRVSDWKKVLVLVTAFTIGHSITLILAALNIIQYDSALIELLIPITILLTCVSNLFHRSSESILDKEKTSVFRYPLALAFGLIHGMGFSSYLRSLLGKETSITLPLFSFNVGLEVGQLVIVALAMSLSFLLLEVIQIKKHSWNLVVSSFVAGVAFKLILEKWVV